jgi:hypothetical protein
MKHLESKARGTEQLKWQNIHADDLPAEVKKSFDATFDARLRVASRALSPCGRGHNGVSTNSNG